MRVSSLEKKKNRYPCALKIVGLMIQFADWPLVYASMLFLRERLVLVYNTSVSLLRIYVIGGDLFLDIFLPNLRKHAQ